jgi:glycosyltransferase involved in cell wall biosynthesis
MPSKTTMAPTISIIIPVYNRERYVGAAIESVLNQTRGDFELVVWDDGSTDDSLDIAHHYAELDQRVRVIAAEHRGVAPAIKAAFAATTGTYIGSVDSDDLLVSTALEETAAILDAHPKVGLVYSDYRLIDESGNDKGLGIRCQIPYSKKRMLVDHITFHFRLLRRRVYDQVGGIDESFKQCEDYDLCLRLSEITNIHHLQKTLYYYRCHTGNMSNQRQESNFWGYQASLQALKRRGLDKRCQLELKNTGVILRCKKATG